MVTEELRSSARDVARGLAPRRYLLRRARRHRWALARELGIHQATRRFSELAGTGVRRGPFAGLVYPPEWFPQADVAVAKVIGSYEAELHPIIEEVIAEAPSLFVDIGAAEGYYAVGFATRSPATRVHVFEVDPWLRRRCFELASVNGVRDQIAIDGLCTGAVLASLDLEGAFVLSDCEGAEARILTDVPVEHLRSTTMLVEMHSRAAGTDVLELLSRRFTSTHDVRTIGARDRSPDAYPELAGFSESERTMLLSEFRSEPTPWALLTPR
jgi:hypothetical protein